MDPIEFIILYLEASDEVKTLVEDVLEECQPHS